MAEKNFIFLLFISIFIVMAGSGCSEEYDCMPSESSIVEGAVPVDDCVENPKSPCQREGSKVNIRIRNFSRYDICNMEYNAYSLNRTYGNIPSGECSCYMSHDTAFYYPARMKFTDYEEDNFLTAIDFISGKLEDGNYNYNLWRLKTPKDDIYRGYMIASEEDPEYYDAISHRCEESVPEGCGVDTTMVNLRIINESIFQMCDFTFEYPMGKLVEYGSIYSGGTTCYIPYKLIDKNNFRIEFSINGEEQGVGLTHPVWQDLVQDGNYSLYVTVGSLNGESIHTFMEQDD